MKTKKSAQTHLSKTLGESLRKLREINHMTQDDIAEKLGVSYQQVQKYESGKNRISIETLIALKNIFGVPFNYFLKQIEEDIPEDEQKSFLYGTYLSKQIQKVKSDQDRSKIIKVVDILCS